MVTGKRFQLGCEALADCAPEWFFSSRLGLLANQASVSQSFEHVKELIQRAGGHLKCLFSPQHGFHSEKQANMEESQDGWDDSSTMPVVSLYGKVREPSAEMLEQIDVLLIDLQDVGTRVYTYGTTMGLCMEAAARAGTKVVVLDRPNPIGGELMEGNLLAPGFRSFVGRYPIPMRHGLTMGELALFIRKFCGVDCDLEVIQMDGWRRGDYFPDTGLQWVFPSPNMPAWETALVYPGMVLLEGTNVSEGRGTTLPFHLFGAPFIDQGRFLKHVSQFDPAGVFLRPVCFDPVFDKWKGETCFGFQIHVTNRKSFRPYLFGLAVIQALRLNHPNDFKWLQPPYEYEWEKLPIDIILGDGAVRGEIESGDDVREIESRWSALLQDYRKKCEEIFLYGA